MKATNGLGIGRSEMYSSKANMGKGIASVAKNAPDANVVDAGGKLACLKK